MESNVSAMYRELTNNYCCLLFLLSLYYHRSLMTHASVPEKERDQLGITDTLVKFYRYAGKILQIHW